MKGLLLRNYYLILKSAKSYILVLLITVFIRFILGTFSSVSIVIFSVFYVSNTTAFSIESLNWRKMEKTLPVSTSTLVLSRYITTFLTAVVFLAVSVILVTGVEVILPLNDILFNNSVSARETAEAVYNIFIISVLNHCFTAPVAILNPNGGKPSEWYIMSVFLTGVVSVAWLFEPPPAIFSILLIIALYIASFKLSVIIYDNTQL